MLPRDAFTLVTLLTSLAAAAAAATTRGPFADLDSEDYEVLADNEARSDDKGKVSSISKRSEFFYNRRTKRISTTHVASSSRRVNGNVCFHMEFIP